MACLFLLLLAVSLADALLAGPARTWAERSMNARLNGYTVSIARVRLHLWRFAFELDDLTLVQNRHPDPPVANLGAMQFSLRWPGWRHFKLAGALTIVRPALHLNLAQIEQQAASHISLEEQGWQRAVESIAPIKLDRLAIVEGSLLYLASAPGSKPIQMTHVQMLAKDVRNIAADPGSYPSPLTLEADLFDSGRVRFDGAADFLREPWAAIQGQLRLVRVPLDRLDPLAQRYQVRTQGGLLSVEGSLTASPERRIAHFRQVLLEDLRMDFVSQTATRKLETLHGRQVARAARSVRNAPELLIQVDHLRLSHSQMGFSNERSRPPYRVFLSELQFDLYNLSNQSNRGRSRFQARGAFMGQGATVASGNFLATAEPADFALQVRLDHAELVRLNALLLAYGGVDVAAGEVSLYTEVTVKQGRLDGYLKPLFRNLKIADKAKDRHKPLLKRVELHMLQGLAGLFRNHGSQDVATVIRLSGSTQDPRTSEWDVLGKLLRNGLFRAILPGFIQPAKPEPKRATRRDP